MSPILCDHSLCEHASHEKYYEHSYLVSLLFAETFLLTIIFFKICFYLYIVIIVINNFIITKYQLCEQVNNSIKLFPSDNIFKTYIGLITFGPFIKLDVVLTLVDIELSRMLRLSSNFYIHIWFIDTLTTRPLVLMYCTSYRANCKLKQNNVCFLTVTTTYIIYKCRALITRYIATKLYMYNIKQYMYNIKQYMYNIK